MYRFRSANQNHEIQIFIQPVQLQITYKFDDIQHESNLANILLTMANENHWPTELISHRLNAHLSCVGVQDVDQVSDRVSKQYGDSTNEARSHVKVIFSKLAI